jgi:hypothetical protein
MQQNYSLSTTATIRTVWWWMALGAVLIGVGLRVWQWLLGTTFFMDELAVLHNLTTRPFGQLVGVPLAEAQVAPPLFLLVEKACLVVLGRSELSLRLPALLASLVSLLLLWSIARRVVDERLVPLVLLTFAVGFTFVYYSNQVKQYAGDVAVTLLVVRLALGLREAKPAPHLFRVAAVAGLVLPFYSQASLMVFAGCGAVLVLLAYFDAGQPHIRITVAVVAAWALGCALSLALAQRTLQPLDHAYMHFFWRDGLLPFNIQLPLALAGELAERWANGLGWPHPASIWVAVSLVGVGLLWRQQRETALLLLAPWLVSISASVLQQFPLRMRLMDFLVPSLILFFFVALQSAVRAAEQINRRLGLALLAAGVLPILYSITRHNLPPYCAEDAKSLFAQLAQMRRPNEAVYAYYGAGQTLRWYGPRFGFLPASYQLGHCYRHGPGAERQYLSELDAFRGQRVWVIMEHFDDYEAQVMGTYLDGIGRRGPHIAVKRQLPDEAVGFPVMYAQLYDLTNSRRAARFAAATFPLPVAPIRQADEACWSCYGPQVIADNKY